MLYLRVSANSKRGEKVEANCFRHKHQRDFFSLCRDVAALLHGRRQRSGDIDETGALILGSGK